MTCLGFALKYFSNSKEKKKEGRKEEVKQIWQVLTFVESIW